MPSLSPTKSFDSGLTEENGNETQSDEEVTVNPCPPDWLGDEENAVLRADAIGDTAYTHRWVLKCLHTVTESLPTYCVKSKKRDENGETETASSDSSEEGESDDAKLMELDSDVEDAVCQLWDMTTSLDVITHLLNLEEINILELANMIIEHSYSPRLTEVILGIVANISCREMGIKRVLDWNSNHDIVKSTLHLLSSTSDVPSLCETFRFLCTLVNYRACNLDQPSSLFLPTWKALCNEDIQGGILFILKNSLSDVLVNRVLDFLSSFLNFTEASLNIAESYGKQELVHSLIDVLSGKYEKFTENLSEEELEPIRHCVACLYAFLGGCGASYLTDELAKSKVLETVLVQIVEYEGKIQSVSDLRAAQTQNIWTSITILKFFIPLITKPSIISAIGRLLSIIYGQTHQYTVTRSTSKEELNLSGCESAAFKEFSEFFELKFAEKLESDKTLASSSIRKEFSSLFGLEKGEEIVNDIDYYATRNDSPAGSTTAPLSVATCGWLSPSPNKDNTRSRKAVHMKLKSKTEISAKEDLERQSEEVEDLKEVLEDYCSDIFGWWWNTANDKTDDFKGTQCSILEALDQCHVHEVIFVLDCVRRKSPLLVAELQEKLLDSGKHVRLVAILSHMYH